MSPGQMGTCLFEAAGNGRRSSASIRGTEGVRQNGNGSSLLEQPRNLSRLQHIFRTYMVGFDVIIHLLVVAAS
jgi:hypothetical protein